MSLPFLNLKFQGTQLARLKGVARREITLIFLLFMIPTSACFQSNATWTPYGERARVEASPVKLTTSTFKVAHGYKAEIPIEGGSGSFSCSFTDTLSQQGSLVLVATSAGAKCVYQAPESGAGLTFDVRVRDEKYPDKTATASITVPASGEPDENFGAVGIITPLGQTLPGTGVHVYLYALDRDTAGRILVGGNQTTMVDDSGTGLVARLLSDGTVDSLFGNAGSHLINHGDCPALSAGSNHYQVVSIKAQTGLLSGILVGVRDQVSLSDVILLLKSDGTLDSTWGTAGCVALGTLSNGADGSTLALDASNSSYFSYRSGAAFGLTRLNSLGAATGSAAVSVPANYTVGTGRRLLAINGTTAFLATPLTHNPVALPSVTGVGFFEFDIHSPASLATSTSLLRGPEGFAFAPFKPPLDGALPELHAFLVDAQGKLQLGYHATVDPGAVGAFNMLGLLSLASPAQLVYLSNPSQELDPLSFAIKMISPPQESSFATTMPPPFAQVATPSPIGSRGSAVQTQTGGVITVGGAEPLTANFAPTISRFSSANVTNGDQDFANAQAHNGEVLLPLGNGGSYTASFQACLIESDGRILVAGAFKKTGFYSDKSVGWISRYWP